MVIGERVRPSVADLSTIVDLPATVFSALLMLVRLGWVSFFRVGYFPLFLIVVLLEQVGASCSWFPLSSLGNLLGV